MLNIEKYQEKKRVKSEDHKAFELVMVERDKKGQPTGKKLKINANNGYALWEFLERNSVKNTKKKTKKSDKGKLPNRQQAEKLLEQANKGK